MTDTFAGIRPIDMPGFVLAQLVGGAVATLLWRWLGRGQTGRPDEIAAAPASPRVREALDLPEASL